MRDLIVAVDVGTGRARAGIFDRHGKQLARADYPIAMNRPEENHAEHDSENIWAAVCIAVKTARAKAGVPALYAKSGLDHVEKGEAYGNQLSEDYTSNRYHKPSDEFDPAWDLGGVMQDLQALYWVGRELGNGTTWPNWYAGNEFKANRDKMMAAKAKAPAP